MKQLGEGLQAIRDNSGTISKIRSYRRPEAHWVRVRDASGLTALGEHRWRHLFE